MSYDPIEKAREKIKPEFVAQSAEPMTDAGRREWFLERAAEFQILGATFFQYSVNDIENPRILLVEGWRGKPPVNSLPEPHFFMTEIKEPGDG